MRVLCLGIVALAHQAVGLRESRIATLACSDCTDPNLNSQWDLFGEMNITCPSQVLISPTPGIAQEWLNISLQTKQLSSGGFLMVSGKSQDWNTEEEGGSSGFCTYTGQTNYTLRAPFGNDTFIIETDPCPLEEGITKGRIQVPIGHCAPPGEMVFQVVLRPLESIQEEVLCIRINASILNHESGAGIPCGDDEYGIGKHFEMTVKDCSFYQNNCASQISAFTENPNVPPDKVVSDICKRTCGFCSPNDPDLEDLCRASAGSMAENPGLGAYSKVLIGGGMIVATGVVGLLIYVCNRQRIVRGEMLAAAQKELLLMKEQDKEQRALLQQKDQQPKKPRRARGASAVPNHWQRVQLLGRGSFGKVYLGLRPDGTFFAVKVLELSSDSPVDKLEELMREVDVMSKLVHENIVEYYGCTFDREKQELQIFMEYEQGGSVGALVRRMELPLSDEVASTYMHQILLGVAYLHSKTVIHRDLKGDNVLLSADGVCKLADFGTSKSVKEGHAATITGTPAWMAPEVISAGAKGAGRAPGESYSFAADIWSCGIITCELMNRGKPPWPRFESAWQAAFTIGSWSKDLPPEVPEVSAVCRRFMILCLKPKPEARPSAQELLRDPFVRGAKVRRLSAARQQIRTGADIQKLMRGDPEPAPPQEGTKDPEADTPDLDEVSEEEYSMSLNSGEDSVASRSGVGLRSVSRRSKRATMLKLSIDGTDTFNNGKEYPEAMYTLVSTNGDDTMRNTQQSAGRKPSALSTRRKDSGLSSPRALVPQPIRSIPGKHLSMTEGAQTEMVVKGTFGGSAHVVVRQIPPKYIPPVILEPGAPPLRATTTVRGHV
eukprot:Hpha_TRINITY_DN29671_c0_g1::TRINITY_DN29671_c0_g1_i1::g.165157::m.165157